MDVIRQSSELIRRYIYGYGSDTSSVGMNPYNFVTRKMTYEMEYIATELHELLLHNSKFLNPKSVDLNQCRSRALLHHQIFYILRLTS